MDIVFARDDRFVALRLSSVRLIGCQSFNWQRPTRQVIPEGSLHQTMEVGRDDDRVKVWLSYGVRRATRIDDVEGKRTLRMKLIKPSNSTPIIIREC